MKFEEAIYYFKQGATIKRHKWPSYDVFYINEKEVNKYALSKEDYLADDWIIVDRIEQPGKSFSEVFEDFEKGKKIRRKVWPKNVGISMKMMITKDDYLMAYMKDLLEKDWEVIE